MHTTPFAHHPSRSIPLIAKQKFRDGMARLGSAVNIITTDGPAGRSGFTASAVCSVTDAPPTLLICVNRSASVYETFMRNTALCVNVLHAEQEQLSGSFGGKTPMNERFATARWWTGLTGAPVLEGATASFDCLVVETTQVGTHSVMFCEVVDIRLHQEAAGLVYFDRRFHRV
jgi:flavin reductase